MPLATCLGRQSKLRTFFAMTEPTSTRTSSPPSPARPPPAVCVALSRCAGLPSGPDVVHAGLSQGRRAWLPCVGPRGRRAVEHERVRRDVETLVEEHTPVP